MGRNLSSADTIWCLMHQTSQRQILGLTTREARAFLMGVESSQKPQWFAWQMGWEQWRSVLVVTELLDPLPIYAGLPIHPPPFHLGGDQNEGPSLFYPSDFVSDSQASSHVKFIEREHQRWARRWPVHILGPRKVFKTFTLDISEGGILLADPLPDWVVGYCDVELLRRGDPQQGLRLTCAVVENQLPQKRVRLQVLEDQVGPKAVIKRWLKAG